MDTFSLRRYGPHTRYCCISYGSNCVPAKCGIRLSGFTELPDFQLLISSPDLIPTLHTPALEFEVDLTRKAKLI